MKRLLPIILFCCALAAYARNSLPQWRKGELEIHHINTCRGECTFFVFPDGTTMLLDAGNAKMEKESEYLVPRVEVTPEEKIISYVRSVMPLHKDSIDYLVVSNFNAGQIGGLDAKTSHTEARKPDYFLSGVTYVCESLKFRKLIDRGFPLYDYPVQNLSVEAKNYVNFIRYQTQHNHLSAERFNVGKVNQIKLLHDVRGYQRYFRVYNLAANGIVWTGKGLDCIPFYSLKHNFKYLKNENTSSIAMRINYGKFSYYTGADLSGDIEEQKDEVTTIDSFVGRICGKVSVCKANDGASVFTNSLDFTNAVKADDYIVMPWKTSHLDPNVMERLAKLEEGAKKPHIFVTSLPEKYLPQNNRYMWGEYISPSTGHVVVKVSNKGKSYKIYIVDDNKNILSQY